MYCDKESIPIRNNFQLSKHRGVNHNPCLSLKLLQNTEQSIYTKLIVYSVFDKMCLYQFQNIGLSCLLYTSPSPRDKRQSRMPSSA